MIEVTQMAEFMDDDIVPLFRSKKSDSILEGEIPDTGTTPETGSLVPDAYLPISKSVLRGELAHTPLDDIPCLASSRTIFPLVLFSRRLMCPDMIQVLFDPLGRLTEKRSDEHARREFRHGHDQFSSGRNGKQHAAHSSAPYDLVGDFFAIQYAPV
jgi:hypothetical protein